MKTPLNCDQVFAKLTAGPVTKGQPDDAPVEEHLAQCVSCRELATAMRPACNLLHESLSCQEREGLPAYLDDEDQACQKNRQAIMAAIAPKESRVQIRLQTRSQTRIGLPKQSPRRTTVRTGSLLASLAIGITWLVMVGGPWSQPSKEPVTPSSLGERSSLGLLCYGRRESGGHRMDEIAVTKGTDCCTKCHHSGGSTIVQPKFEILLASCNQCHADG